MALDSFVSLWSIISLFAVDWSCAAVVLRCFRKANKMTKFKTKMLIRMQRLCTMNIVTRMMYPFSHKPNSHPKSMKYAQHVTLAMRTRLFVTLTRYCKGVTEANTLSPVRSNTCPELTSVKTKKDFSTDVVSFSCWKMAQPQYTINGHTTIPTRRSAIAIDTMMRLEGEDLSFFKGSFQTDKTTNEFPRMIIGDMTIAGKEKNIDMACGFPTFRHTLSPKSLSLV